MNSQARHIDWKALGDRLGELASHTYFLLNIASSYPADSPFARLSEGQERHERDMIRPTVISEAIASVSMSLVAANDSIHAMGEAFSSKRPFPVLGFAAGTLTRSALESLARAHYLQSGADQETMLRRWMTLRVSNVENMIKESSSDLDRSAKDHATRRRLRAAADALGIARRDQTISFGRMTVDLLDTVIADRPLGGVRMSGSSEYSFLSSLAHGEAAGHAHMTTVLSRGTGNFGLNQTTVGMNSNTFARCTLSLMPAYLSVIAVFLMGCGVANEEIVAWQQSVVEAFAQDR
jgi:hypothetical protein